MQNIVAGSEEEFVPKDDDSGVSENEVFAEVNKFLNEGEEAVAPKKRKKSLKRKKKNKKNVREKKNRLCKLKKRKLVTHDEKGDIKKKRKKDNEEKKQEYVWVSVRSGLTPTWEKLMAGTPFRPENPPYRWSIKKACDSMTPPISKAAWKNMWSFFCGKFFTYFILHNNT